MRRRDKEVLLEFHYRLPRRWMLISAALWISYIKCHSLRKIGYFSISFKQVLMQLYVNMKLRIVETCLYKIIAKVFVITQKKYIFLKANHPISGFSPHFLWDKELLPTHIKLNWPETLIVTDRHDDATELQLIHENFLYCKSIKTVLNENEGILSFHVMQRWIVSKWIRNA